MKLLSYSLVGLVIVLGFITILASSPTPTGGARFTDMGNGTVKDEDSGLIWLKNANCFVNFQGFDGYGRADWDTAMQAADHLESGQCGLSDGSVAGNWRLPTIEEWAAFVTLGQGYPPNTPSLCNAAGTAQWTQGDAFLNVSPYAYWSGSLCGNNGVEGVYMHEDPPAPWPCATKTWYGARAWPVRDM